MQFKLIKGGDTIRKHDLNILQETIYELRDHEDSFVVLEPKQPIENSIYLQAILQGDIYVAEIRFVFGDTDNYKHYSKAFANKEELFDVFAEYYINSKVPNIDLWENDRADLSDEVEDSMVKLYKKVNENEIRYFEIWTTDDGLTIHKGTLGDVGETHDLPFGEHDKIPRPIAMAKYIADQKELGYDEMQDFTELIIQYPYNDETHQAELLSMQDKMEDILNNSLGWTGNGHCDGGDIGSGTMNLFCYVVDKEIALITILDVLDDEGFITSDMRIGYADSSSGEYLMIYPEKGSFNLI